MIRKPKVHYRIIISAGDIPNPTHELLSLTLKTFCVRTQKVHGSIKDMVCTSKVQYRIISNDNSNLTKYYGNFASNLEDSADVRRKKIHASIKNLRMYAKSPL